MSLAPQSDPDLATLEKAAERFLRPFGSSVQAGGLSVLTQKMRPDPNDYTKVFVEPAAQLAKERYGELWEGGLSIERRPSQTEIHIRAVRVSEMKQGNMDGFPGGYARILHLLQPDAIMLLFRFVEPGKNAGMRYDGLVHIDQQRWAWFPKPWRFVL